MAPTTRRANLEIRQSERDGLTRVSLVGELDLASMGELEERLRVLKQSGVAVELDLSELVFIDSSGLRVIVTSLQDARRDGWQLGIDPTVLPQVRRVVELVGVTALLWPTDAADADGAG